MMLCAFGWAIRRLQACFTAYVDGVPAGMSTLYLQPYQKFAHQCLFAIIVDEKYRNHGIGKALLEYMSKEAKEKFNIEILHLEVYEGNPAYRLYERMGFQEFGRQPRFHQDRWRISRQNYNAKGD